MLRLIFVLFLAQSMLGCVSAPDQTLEASQAVEASKAPSEYAGNSLEQWLSWSEPDNGLAARIEYLIPPGTHDGGAIYLRLKNVGDEPITVPAGEIAGFAWTRCFELYRWEQSRWEPTFWPGTAGWRFRSEPNALQLMPGETTLVGLTHSLPESIMAASHFKIVVNLPSARVRQLGNPDDQDADPFWIEGPWIDDASVQTPPFPTRFADSMTSMRARRYPAPDHWPFEITAAQQGGWYPGWLGSAPPNAVLLSDIITSNLKRIRLLPLYTSEDIRVVTERLMDQDNIDPHWQILYAMLAACEGSKKGQALLENIFKTESGEVLRSAIYAIGYLLAEDRPQPWAEQAAITLIQDHRVIRQEERYTQTVADLAISSHGNMVYRLADRGCVDAVPALIARIQSVGGEQSTISALGQIGDPRANNLMLELLNEKLNEGWDPDYGKPTILHAVGKMQLKQAVPSLIEHINKKGVPEALGRIGDTRAIPALRQLAETEHPQAMIALYRLGEPGMSERLIDILNNPQDGFERLDAMYALTESLDPRMIPTLIKTIRQDESGMVANIAIRDLSEYRCSEAVEGLIQSFDVDFSQKAGWKPAYKPEHYTGYIAEALTRMTGQTLGNNPDAWRAWWEATGKKTFKAD